MSRISKLLGRIQILFQSATEKTSLESFDSINDEDPPYKNFLSNKKLGLQRSKSMQFPHGKTCRAGLLQETAKKVPDQFTGLRNRGPLKDLNVVVKTYASK